MGSLWPEPGAEDSDSSGAQKPGTVATPSETIRPSSKALSDTTISKHAGHCVSSRAGVTTAGTMTLQGPGGCSPYCGYRGILIQEYCQAAVTVLKSPPIVT